MTPSAAAVIEAETLADWMHVLSPLDSWGLYEVITDGLLDAKRDHHAALAAHDHVQAEAALREVTDLTWLAATAATALALTRARYLAQGHRWPLGSTA